MHPRRDVLAGLGAVVAWPALARLPDDALGAGTQKGWAALDLAAGRRSGLNATMRLPLCSSFKWLLAACILWRAERGLEGLDRPVAFDAAALLPASPVMAAAVRATMPPRICCSRASAGRPR